MPVTSQTPLISYTASGSATNFPFSFKAIESADLKVFINGLLQTSGYSVTGFGVDTGGTVTFAVAPTAGSVVRLQRLVSLDRQTDWVEGGALPATTLDYDSDRVVMMMQDLNAIVFKESSDGTFNVANRRVSSLGDPVLPDDADTKNYVDNTIPASVSAAAASAAAAAASATAMAGSQAASAASATAAATSATNAATSAAAAALVTATSVQFTTATGSAILPSGTSAQRDATPVFGYTRANSTLNIAEWWNGTGWVPMGGGATGGVGNYAFVENDVVVSADYTITTNKNAMTAGPITINNGVTVTVPNGSVWSIV